MVRGYDRATPIIDAIEAKDGVLRPRACLRAKISPWWISEGIDATRVTRGLYVRGQIAPLALTVGKTPRLVVGLGTALWLHRCLAIELRTDCFVIGLGDRIPSWTARPAQFVRSSWPRLHTVEMTFDHVPLSVHIPSRAAVDCVRNLAHDQGAAAVRLVLTAGVSRDELIEVAEETRFGKPMRRFLRRL